MNWILEQFPAFRPMWEKHLHWWGEDDPGLGNNAASFSQYVQELITHDQMEEVKHAMAAIEKLLTQGDDAVRAAIATNCLENLINCASNGRFGIEPLVKNLGKASRAYCIEWDRFTGAQTPGLLSSQDSQ